MEVPAQTARTSEPRAAEANLNADSFPWPPRSYPGKRLLDVLMAGGLLLLSAPLFPLVALVIKLTSPGPIFFRGRRVGQAGQEFALLKFRTMSANHSGGAITAAGDVRITPVGHVLRRLKIDELPQLLNILRGEMAIVGPRPEALEIVRAHYTHEQLRVLSAPAGLTGPLQVRVFPDISSEIPAGVDPQEYYLTTLLPARIEEDLEYVDQMSLWLDLKVIVQTAYCVLIKSWWR